MVNFYNKIRNSKEALSSEDKINNLLDEDEITIEEAGFMQGYVKN